MKRLFFVRHGETEWNAISRMQGQLDSELNELGRTQSDVNGRLLERFAIEALYASPLVRARQSAEIINGYLRLPIRYDPRIKEWNCGDWSGLLYDEVKARWPDEWGALEADPYHYRGPNCENYPDMIARVAPFVAELLAHPARSIAIVSHGIVGRIMVSLVLKFDERETLRFRQPNDVLYRVTLANGRATVDHYVGGAGPAPGLVPRKIEPQPKTDSSRMS